MEWITDQFVALQQWVFEAAVQPLVYAVGLGGWGEDAFDATGWLLIGLIEVLVLLAVIGPLQRWRPAEAVSDRGAIRTDIVYTLIHRLGLFLALSAGFWSAICIIISGPLWTRGWPEWWTWWLNLPIWS